MKLLLFLTLLIIVGINIIIGAFTIGIFNEMQESNKILISLSEEVSKIQNQVTKNKVVTEANKSQIQSNHGKITYLERSILNNKNNIVISIDEKLSKLSSDIRSILATENGKANTKLNNIEIYLSKLHDETKKGLNTHDGNFSKLNDLLEEYANVAKFIKIQSKNGMKLQHLDKRN